MSKERILASLSGDGRSPQSSLGRLIHVMSPIILGNDAMASHSANSVGPNCATLVDRGLIPEERLSDDNLTEYLAGMLLDMYDAKVNSEANLSDGIDFDEAQSLVAQKIQTFRTRERISTLSAEYSTIESLGTTETERYATAMALISIGLEYKLTRLPFWYKAAKLS